MDASTVLPWWRGSKDLIHGLRPFERPPTPKGGRLARISCFTQSVSRSPGVRRAYALQTAVCLPAIALA